MSTKIVFMGTPQFAVPSLERLIETSLESDWEVVGVVTQPDRRQGRGKKVSPPPVKVAAEQANIPIFQPETLRTDDAFSTLVAFAPDLIIVAAFGQILKPNVLALPQFGCLNVHASLLPRWRGAAPIAAAIQAGDQETGITLMQMNEGLDTGPMLYHQTVPIRLDDTTETLTKTLAQVGADLLVETLPAWLKGEITAIRQDDHEATLAPRLAKQAGSIDWFKPAAVIERQVRAFFPWPGTFTDSQRGRFKVLSVDVSESVANTLEPGTLFKHNKQVWVATGHDSLRLVMVQPAGKKAMPAEAMLNGMPDLWETRLGESE
ncbi:MAG: methionyl-tRNA formyltransferase [Chloroflexota bacterium]